MQDLQNKLKERPGVDEIAISVIKRLMSQSGAVKTPSNSENTEVLVYKL
jgi:hypothetical protein